MKGIFLPVLAAFAAAALIAGPGTQARAQDSAPADGLDLLEIKPFAPPSSSQPLATRQKRELILSAAMTTEGPDIPRGLVWRVFKPEPAADGKLPLVASAHGGSAHLELDPGSYLVHAAFGRAGATKRITVTRNGGIEKLVLDAGGLKLDAVLPGGINVPRAKLRFSVYEAGGDPSEEGSLIVPDVKPGAVVRLNAGTYHVVSTYGNVNAVQRSDIRVEAGKLTEATVEHQAAEATFKLVRAPGGEAMADTSWALLTEAGDPVRDGMVGAYASMVLAQGNYTVVAKNRDRIYQKDFSVEAGRNREVEVIATEDADSDALEGAD